MRIWDNVLVFISLCLVLAVPVLAESHQAEGSLKWHYWADSGSDYHSPPAIGPDGSIYYGSGKFLIALDAEGQLKWNYETGGLVASPAIDSAENIYAASTGLYAFDSNGSMKWTYKTGYYDFQTPAIGANDTIYFPSENGKLSALNANGTPLWSYEIGSGPSSPAIDINGTIYVCGDENTYAINPDGILKWSIITGSCASPVIGPNNSIYIGSYVNGLYAINSDGTLKWHNDTVKISSSPSVGPDGTIYIGALYGSVYSFNPDGSLKWRYSTRGTVRNPPTIGSNGMLYASADSDNYLYAIDSNGSLQWQYETGGIINSAPTLGPDGTLYVGSADQYLYAFYTSSRLANSTWPMFQHDFKHTGRIWKSEEFGSSSNSTSEVLEGISQLQPPSTSDEVIESFSNLDNEYLPAGEGAKIYGKIYYNNEMVTKYSNAPAVIWLVDISNWSYVPVDYKYNNQTGEFIIEDLHPGNYTPFVRLESGYPFDADSGGDFHSIHSSTNPDILVPLDAKEIHNDLRVTYSIHLIKPVDTQERRTLVADPPETLNKSSVKFFEWEPVPAAESYLIRFNLKGDKGISEWVNKTKYYPDLRQTSENEFYEFTMEAYNKDNELIGTFHNYYKNGYGGWLKFKVSPDV